MANRLDRICLNCGRRYGEHGGLDEECPTGARTFHATQKFNGLSKYEDDDKKVRIFDLE